MKRLLVALLGFICLFLLTGPSVFAQSAAQAIVDKECARCHNIKRVYNANKKAAEWEVTLERMIKKGAAIKPEERDAVLNYLNTLNK